MVTAFNDMLVQIQERDGALQKGRDELEQRVQERTAELEAAKKKVEEFSDSILHAKEEVERASKFKDQFLSTMSHELRTPLNAILGFSDLLPDERYGPLTERQRRYVAHIHTSGQHLLSLINDILDLSKIEAGHVGLTFESVRVETAFAEVVDTLRPLADKKSQTLSQHAENGLNVRADATRFKQVLMNLVGNAIKFSPESGDIELAACLIDGKVRVEVRDTGPGIPLEEQKRIFENFYRLRQSEKSTEGTGLGLAITQKLVELHGGELGLESQPGHGSRFYFSLPMAPAPRERPVQETGSVSRTSESPRILVIEDDPATAQLIELQLISSGYEVVVCAQPHRAAEIAAGLQPSAITLDLLMKPTNGWEVLVQLKRDPRTANIPVIVITIADQPAMGAILGADDYLVKPVDKMDLLAAMERCLGTRVVQPARSILVVEDDAAAREFITELLTAQGHTVTNAADGAQARAQVGTALPKLVILDLLLPEVSGFELLAEWRANPRTADLPVFVLTSKDLSREEETYLRAHAERLFYKQQPWQEALASEVRRAVSSGQMENA
jgi:signal transduction histidine kinase/CheY-like chemotaxis protein